MQLEEELIDLCKRLIEEKTGWGDSQTWKSQDFTDLSEKIYEHTRVNLSPTTLKRVWGKVKYDSLPNLNTLNTLANFAGYENWREFKRKNSTSISPLPSDIQGLSELPLPVGQSENRSRFQTKNIGIIVFILVMAGMSWMAIQTYSKSVSSPPSQTAAAFSFSSKPVTKGIPNSVVFTYDASAAETDSIFIQQSWDPKRRFRVPKDKHLYTSVYYQPGFFKAKLVINNEVVKEHDLLIPSDGWVTSIQQEPVPVYFPEKEINHKGTLTVSVSQLESKHILLQPKPPVVTFCNVQDFKGLRSDDFIFETELTNDYYEGSAICQFTQIMLLLENDMISIPLSNPGCVSDLKMSVGGQFLDGKTTDLSALGSNLQTWTKVRMEAKGKAIQIFINGKKSFETLNSATPARIIGIQYGFQGTGSIRYTKLQRMNGELVFAANTGSQAATL